MPPFIEPLFEPRGALRGGIGIGYPERDKARIARFVLKRGNKGRTGINGGGLTAHRDSLAR